MKKHIARYISEFFYARYRCVILVAGAIFILLRVLLISFSQMAMEGLISLNQVIPNATDLDKASPEQMRMFTLENPAMHEVVFNYGSGVVLGLSAPMAAIIFCAASFIGRPYVTGNALYEHTRVPQRFQRWFSKTIAVLIISLFYTLVMIVLSVPIYLYGTSVAAAWKVLPVENIVKDIALSTLVMLIAAAIGASLAWLFRDSGKPLLLFAGVVVVEQIAIIILKFAHISYVKIFFPVTALRETISITGFGVSPFPVQSGLSAAMCAIAWGIALLLMSWITERRREIPIIT